MELPRLDLPQTGIPLSPTIRKAIVGVNLKSEACNSDFDFGE